MEMAKVSIGIGRKLVVVRYPVELDRRPPLPAISTHGMEPVSTAVLLPVASTLAGRLLWENQWLLHILQSEKADDPAAET